MSGLSFPTAAPLEAFQDTPPASPHTEFAAQLFEMAAVLGDIVPAPPGSRAGMARHPIDFLPGIVAVTLPFVQAAGSNSSCSGETGC